MPAFFSHRCYVLCGFLALVVGAAGAQAGATTPDDRWRISLVPYIWLPFVDTSFTVKGVPVEGEAKTNSSEFFDQLEFALMGTAEVARGRFSVIGDFQYVRLGGDFSTGLPSGEVLDSDYDLGIGSALGMLTYRVIEEPKVNVDVAAGARLLWLDFSAELERTGGRSADGEETITVVDPVVGARGRFHFDDRWSISGYGNVGGFGVGTDFTWEALGTIDYRFSEMFQLRAGYRAFAIDLEEGGLELDTILHGPIVGFVFTF